MFKARLYLPVLAGFLLCSCATPVLQKSVMEQGTRNPNLTDLVSNPACCPGKLFIFGGIIASTTVTKEGSLVEGIYVPVNESGDLQNTPAASRRFLALYREGLLDPVIYNTGRLITLAGTFMETRKGKLGETEYTYPFFHIKEIYLWPKEPEVYYYAPAPYYPGYPWYRRWY